MSGLVELTTGSGAGAVAQYPRWLLYLLGSLLFAGGVFTITGLMCAGLLFGAVAVLLARRVEQSGQFLLCGALTALGSAALSFGLRGMISGLVDMALGAAALARGVTISRVIARGGLDGTGFGG